MNTVEDRRRKLVKTLVELPEDKVRVNGTMHCEGRFCAFGVAAKLVGVEPDNMDDDDMSLGVFVREQYDMSSNLHNHLVEMNDRTKDEIPTTTWPQVSRFLEKVWGL